MVVKIFNLDYCIITASQRHNTGSSLILKILKNRSTSNPVIHDLIDVDFTKIPYFLDRKKRYMSTIYTRKCKKILKIYE